MLCALWLPAGGAPAHAAPAPTPSPLSLTGKAVSFNLSGFEPDFDPLYKVIVTGTLHDRRPTGRTLPDATLVLSAYLESFQPDTTPVLPDLLHPNRVASDLGGFLQGKAALVNAGGRIVYHGSLLAEIFLDGTEHLVVDLTPAGAAPDAASTRLQGTIILTAGGAEDGTLQALQPLARAALAVPHGPAPSWQTVVAGLSVRPPAMVGTAGPATAMHGVQTGPGTPVAPVRRATEQTRRLTCATALVGGVVLALGLCIGAAWWRYAGRPGRVLRA
jgi:hypothetical protein